MFCVLMALVKCDGKAGVYTLDEESGYSRTTIIKHCKALIERGWIVRFHHGPWYITERGKIALAIEVGRRSKKK
jgi:hypothetical protein